MGTQKQPDPVLLIAAVFSGYPEALDWAEERLQGLFGNVVCSSLTLCFDQTRYYEPTMGPALRKRFLAFERLVPPDALAEVKLRSNELERDLASSGRFPVPRPLNIDPGILALGKFMLATTKDMAHRIYLRDGICAEVTLYYRAGSYEPYPWTYADYRQEAVRAFLRDARDWYYRQLRSRPCRPEPSRPGDEAGTGEKAGIRQK